MKARNTLIGVGVSVALVLSSASAAIASPRIATDIHKPAIASEAIDYVDSLDDSKIVESTVLATQAVGDIPLGSGEITVPKDPREGITFTSPNNEQITVTPVAGAQWSAPVTTNERGVTYSNNEGFSETVIVGDGVVQMLTTITDRSAPTEYHYDIALRAGQKLEIVNGAPAVVNADGSFDLVVQSPWAVEAKGNSVPTHYEVEGSTLTQVVNHQSLDASSYPVVADPVMIPAWLLRCLIGMGLNSTSILRSAEMGSFWGVFGKAAWYCIRGR